MLWDEATADDVARASTQSLGLVPASARRATTAETQRLVGGPEEHKVLWISQHPTDRAPSHITALRAAAALDRRPIPPAAGFEP